MATSAPPTEPRSIGRYLLHHEFAVGGMARVCLGKLRGEADFARVVAIKQLFPQYARDPEFVAMFLDEARVAARVRHPNVAGTLDIVSDGGELFLVMEYIDGETLARLLALARERFEPVEPAVISAIMRDMLEGLHAAHTATGADGAPLNIVHRDVSPQNLLVGADGVSRVVDFGVAKAIGRMQKTDDGQVKGKLVYMPPEQVTKSVDLRADVWAAGAVLWEMLAGRRLFEEVSDALAYHAGTVDIVAPSAVGQRATPLDAVAMRALARAPEERFQSAREMIVALERAVPPAPARRVGLWVQRLAEATLAKRRALVADVEAYHPPPKGTELGQSTLSAASVHAEVAGREGRGVRSAAPFAIAIVATALLLGVAVVAGGPRLAARRAATNGPTAATSAAPAPSPPAASHEAPAPPTLASATGQAASAAPSHAAGKHPSAPRVRGGAAAHVPTTTAAAAAATAEPPPPAETPPAATTATAPTDPRELHRRK